ncbi:hypothetical protein DFH09DRAFT_1330636 [Mycena vulgaris]|nr:hypothetical protein DFH09DRAFT_1330636 [Mycena vulgaris]
MRADVDFLPKPHAHTLCRIFLLPFLISNASHPIAHTNHARRLISNIPICLLPPPTTSRTPHLTPPPARPELHAALGEAKTAVTDRCGAPTAPSHTSPSHHWDAEGRVQRPSALCPPPHATSPLGGIPCRDPPHARSTAGHARRIWPAPALVPLINLPKPRCAWCSSIYTLLPSMLLRRLRVGASSNQRGGDDRDAYLDAYLGAWMHALSVVVDGPSTEMHLYIPPPAAATSPTVVDPKRPSSSPHPRTNARRQHGDEALPALPPLSLLSLPAILSTSPRSGSSAVWIDASVSTREQGE